MMNTPGFNEQSGKTIITVSIVVIIASLIIGYAVFQSRNLIHGPQITLKTPISGSTVANPLVAIAGSAKNISFISLNGRQIYVDEQGNFTDELLLSPGYNQWKVEARDKFGRIVSKNIELVLKK